MDPYILIWVYILAGVFGLCVGSFLNVLIYRLPRGMNIVFPASHCTNCNYKLKWYDNIPVLSYIILRGKCRNCGARISPRYTIVEILNCLIWLACVWAFNSYGIGYIVCSALALSALIVVFFSDLETMLIPDSMTIGVALCAIAELILEIFGLGIGISWPDRLIGGVAAFAVFALIYFIFLRIKKREGLGFGDVKLVGAIGLLLGWQSLILCIILACVGALVTVLIVNAVSSLKAKKSPPDNAGAEESGEENEETSQGGEFPFGPFLAAAAAVCVFFGQTVIQWYTGLFM